MLISAVPASVAHPQNLLEYYVNDSNTKLIITTPEYQDLVFRVSKNTNTTMHILDDKLKQSAQQKTSEKQSDMEGGLSYDFYNKSNAMILYTSGTTGKPKGHYLKKCIEPINKFYFRCFTYTQEYYFTNNNINRCLEMDF